MKRALLYLIRMYQKHLSPHLGDNCRFRPTCSQYAYEAVEEWGIIAGSALAVWRLLRCNPFNKHWGFDPVPKRKKKTTDQRPLTEE